jgi:hypothetical protein
MATTSRNTSFGGHITEAATYAQDELERLRTVSWGDLTLSNGAHNNSITGSSGIRYDRDWTVVTTGNIIKTVTLTINWTDQTAHSFTITSMISNPNQ